MIVIVCPAAVTSASPEGVWRILTDPERFGVWNDETFVSADPPGPLVPGQTIHLTAPSLGRNWPMTLDVGDMDPQGRWIDLVARLPFGIESHEHLTLSQTGAGTLVRFN